MAFAFKCFVIFAEMRTGSNFLQSHLKKFPNLHCFGELFNPVFIDRPDQSSALGLSMADRDKNPVSLLREIRKNRANMQGFRYFHHHDPRILSALFKDPSCAKIILTRNPIDSFVSLKIARETGQWNLFDTRQKKTTKVKFVAEEFETQLSKLQFFQELILQRLQMSGQTGFYLRYDDLNNLSVINGLGNYLGSAHKLKDLSSRYKTQNPTYLRVKVVNPEDMQTALASMDPFKLISAPSFEPNVRQPCQIRSQQRDHLCYIYRSLLAQISPLKTGWPVWIGLRRPRCRNIFRNPALLIGNAAMPRIAALPFYAIRLPKRIAHFAPCSPRAGRNARGFCGTCWTFNMICIFQKKLRGLIPTFTAMPLKSLSLSLLTI
jgi:hypothetical protein